MSHVAKIQLEIKDLEALKSAAKKLGLVFVKNQKTFRWYGTHVGDYPLPEGFSKKDMGHCDHALVIPDNKNAYEIGVCKSRDGSKGYTLLWDFWAGGYGLTDKVGKDGGKLKQAYTESKAKKELLSQGFQVEVTHKKNGVVQLRAY